MTKQGYLRWAALALSALMLAGSAAGQVVNFPDWGLEYNVRHALDRTAGPITQQDMLELQSLTLLRRVMDLRGLEYALNLTELQGSQVDNISDLSPLSGLTQLEKVVLGGDELSDLTPLSGLSKLNLLGLGHEQIGDISPVAGLTGLRTLAIKAQLADPTPLAGMTWLEGLGFGPGALTDLDLLSGLTNLQILVLSQSGPVHGQVSDISALAGMRGLIELNLARERISDVSPLASLTNLERLSLPGNLISDISPLAQLTNLKQLYLRENPLAQEAYDLYLPLIQANNPGVHLEYDPVPEPGSLCLLGLAWTVVLWRKTRRGAR